MVKVQNQNHHISTTQPHKKLKMVQITMHVPRSQMSYIQRSPRLKNIDNSMKLDEPANIICSITSATSQDINPEAKSTLF